MSGTRANASARNKRAGGADINSNGGPVIGQRGSSGQPGQGQQSQGQLHPKLSISDAIGLLSLRLGRVEQIVQTIQTTPNDPTSISDNSNSALVDKQVFDNIVKRLDTLEKQKSIPTTNNIGTNLPNISQLVTIQKHEAFVKDISKEIKDMKDQLSKIPVNLTNEITELKEMLLKLQMFTMETNQKLVNMMFNESPQFEVLEQNDKEEGSQIIDDFNMKFFGSNIIELSQNEVYDNSDLVIENA